MSETIAKLVKQQYKYRVTSELETESAPPGLNQGVIFCAFSEVVQEHPDLVRK